MRNNLLFIVFVVLGCRQTLNTSAEIENLFKPMIEEEINYVSRNMHGLEADKGKEWYRGDSVFYHLWIKGAREELNGNLKKALGFYTQALNTPRYEISSYEIKLSLGRLYLQLDNKELARKMLKEFKVEAETELKGDDVEWALTDEAKEALSRDIEDCNFMLDWMEVN